MGRSEPSSGRKRGRGGGGSDWCYCCLWHELCVFFLYEFIAYLAKTVVRDIQLALNATRVNECTISQFLFDVSSLT